MLFQDSFSKCSPDQSADEAGCQQNKKHPARSVGTKRINIFLSIAGYQRSEIGFTGQVKGDVIADEPDAVYRIGQSGILLAGIIPRLSE